MGTQNSKEPNGHPVVSEIEKRNMNFKNSCTKEQMEEKIKTYLSGIGKCEATRVVSLLYSFLKTSGRNDYYTCVKLVEDNSGNQPWFVMISVDVYLKDQCILIKRRAQ